MVVILVNEFYVSIIESLHYKQSWQYNTTNFICIGITKHTVSPPGFHPQGHTKKILIKIAIKITKGVIHTYT